MIPIQNLYYLLSYAWDHPLPEAGWNDIAPDDPRDALNLLATALVQGVDDLVRRGLERGYTSLVEATAQPRGRVLFKESLPLLTRRQLRLVVEHDELNHDTLRNRLLRTTLDALIRSDNIDAKHQRKLHAARAWFKNITPLVISPGVFTQTRPARHNRHYRFLLHLCELIHRLQLPSRQAGHLRFRELLQDEVLMRRVFEVYVQRFAKAHAPCDMRVSAGEGFPWFETGGEAESLRHLPGMKTDLMLHQTGGRVCILDCKYYAAALARSPHSETLRHQTGNLYQLFAYQQNYAAHHPSKQVSGVLLYPMNGTSLKHRYELCGHETRVCTLNLDQKWSCIEADLRAILF